ncbi:MAG: hypothetical protein JST85_01825 [Acidobacteria bacterium]|nr:hypothetical protein [Acidobacteriota bacterium]
MKLRPFKIILFAVCTLLLAVAAIAAQKKTIQPDLSTLADGKSWKVAGHKAAFLEEGGKKIIRFNEVSGAGIAWLEGLDFNNGVIEFDAKGKDEYNKSFVGVAFRGVDETTHDVVYFRPFNFKTDDPERKIHAVQYVSQPNFTWDRLRKERSGQYEKAIFPNPKTPAPDPNDWFHARIVVAKPKISVYVNDAKEPSLVVNEISDRKGGWVGFWVGSSAGGDFANLKITPAK